MPGLQQNIHPTNRRQRLRHQSDTDPGHRQGRKNNLLLEPNAENCLGDQEAQTVYNIPCSEDVASWKMCVQKSLREIVLREDHDAPSARHFGS